MLRAPGPYVASSPRPSRSFRSRWFQPPHRTGQRWSPSSTPCSPSETSTAATDPYFGGVELVDQLDRSTSAARRERLHRPASRTRSRAHCFALSWSCRCEPAVQGTRLWKYGARIPDSQLAPHSAAGTFVVEGRRVWEIGNMDERALSSSP